MRGWLILKDKGHHYGLYYYSICVEELGKSTEKVSMRLAGLRSGFEMGTHGMGVRHDAAPVYLRLRIFPEKEKFGRNCLSTYLVYFVIHQTMNKFGCSHHLDAA
jgi:hypothetical protein